MKVWWTLYPILLRYTSPTAPEAGSRGNNGIKKEAPLTEPAWKINKYAADQITKSILSKSKQDLPQNVSFIWKNSVSTIILTSLYKLELNDRFFNQDYPESGKN